MATSAVDAMAQQPATYVDNTNRFTGLAENYAKYRNSYPPEAVAFITKQLNVPPDAVIGDLGSGTGLLSQIFLSSLPESRVVGIEPNDDMRLAGDKQLASWIASGRFSSVKGTAENTTVEDHTFDLVIAGAAFHWFDGPSTRKEVMRIVKPRESQHDEAAPGRKGAPVAIGTRWRRDPSTISDPYIRETTTAMMNLRYEWGIDHTVRIHDEKFSEESIDAFFGAGNWTMRGWEGKVEYDWERLHGMVSSLSATPRQGTEKYDQVMAATKRVFDKYQRDGKIGVARDMAIYFGYVS